MRYSHLGEEYLSELDFRAVARLSQGFMAKFKKTPSRPRPDAGARLPEAASCLLWNTPFHCSSVLELSPTTIFILLLGPIIQSVTTKNPNGGFLRTEGYVKSILRR